MKLGFGRFRGLHVAEIAATDEGECYLEWLVGQPWIWEPLRDECVAEVKRRLTAQWRRIQEARKIPPNQDGLSYGHAPENGRQNGHRNTPEPQRRERQPTLV